MTGSDNATVKTDPRDTGDPGSARFEVASYPFYQLNRTVSRYNRMIEKLLRTIDLDIPTWRVLMILGERSPLALARVADSAVINISTLTRIVERMKRTGYVVTAPSKTDARVTEIALSALGRKKLEAARARTAPLYAQAIDGFSARDFERFLGLIGRLHDNLENAPPA